MSKSKRKKPVQVIKLATGKTKVINHNATATTSYLAKVITHRGKHLK